VGSSRIPRRTAGVRGGPHPQLNNRQDNGQSQRSIDPPVYESRHDLRDAYISFYY